MKAKATYTVKKWEERDHLQISPGTKMTKASVEYALTGDIEGKASVEYVMFYSHFDPTDQHKAAASYMGLIFFEGTVAGMRGSFVIEDRGAFEAGTAKSTLWIAKGSGAGDLSGIHGSGKYIANQDGFHFELDFDLE
jgi:hypothetical protein